MSPCTTDSLVHDTYLTDPVYLEYLAGGGSQDNLLLRPVPPFLQEVRQVGVKCLIDCVSKVVKDPAHPLRPEDEAEVQLRRAQRARPGPQQLRGHEQCAQVLPALRARRVRVR